MVKTRVMLFWWNLLVKTRVMLFWWNLLVETGMMLFNGTHRLKQE